MNPINFFFQQHNKVNIFGFEGNWLKTLDLNEFMTKYTLPILYPTLGLNILYLPSVLLVCLSALSLLNPP